MKFIITGHNSFSTGILGAAEMIMGKQDNVVVVDFLLSDDVESLHSKLGAILDSGESEEEIIIFTDLAGGSPFNRAMMACAERWGQKIHVLAGINLPLLLEAFNLRGCNKDGKDLVNQLLEIGATTICYGNKMLEEEMGPKV